MESFTRIAGIAAPLHRSNIDTDLLIPSREITHTGKEGYGEKLLAPWRYRPAAAGEPRIENPEFVLNQLPFRQAVILIAGENFGSGSSREAAVWAVRQFGFRCVIAPSFGAIFRNNCWRNGVLPVLLSAAEVDALAERAAGGQLVLTVDLVESVIVDAQGARIAFVVPPAERRMLLEGQDAIGLTLLRRAEIEAFQQSDRLTRPWIWQLERK
jgi:3-isopropylmalate/(R)-2-methylmalate dehydratase small subunit